MKITNGYSNDVTPRSTRAVVDPSSAARTSATDSASAGTSSTPRDSVELSAEGLARSKDATLTEQRIAQIRQNVLQGAYDSTHVVDQIAKRLLASGDV